MNQKSSDSLRADERGSVAILFALVLVALCGVAGLAIDYSRARNLQTKMQMSLDAALLAAAKSAHESKFDTAAQIFLANLGAVGAQVGNPVFSSGAEGTLAGTVTGQLLTSFSRVLGFHELDVVVRSEATIGSSAGICILVLDTSANQALLLNGGAAITAPDCEVQVKSTASPAAVFNSGTILNVGRTCIAGRNVIDNGGSHPHTEVSCETIADPFAGSLSHPDTSGCNVSNANYNGGDVTLNPGVYCGWINFNAAPRVHLNPGVYVIKQGGWNVNGGTWTGDGVVFYFADTSKIQFNSAVKADLTPPQSGDYEGIMFFETEGLPRSQLVFDDSLGFSIEGLIYLPSRDVTFNSDTSVESRNLTMVVNTLILNQTRWNLESSEREICGGRAGNVHLIK